MFSFRSVSLVMVSLHRKRNPRTVIEFDFYFCDKYCDQKQWGEIAAYLDYTFQSQIIVKRTHDRNSRQGLGGRNWSRYHGVALLTCLCPMPCSTCLRMYSRMTSTVVWAFAQYSSVIIFPKGLHQTNQKGGIFSLDIPSSQLTLPVSVWKSFNQHTCSVTSS